MLNGQDYVIPVMLTSETPFVDVLALTASALTPPLTTLGETTQLELTADFSDGTSGPLLTTEPCGPVYTTSNPKIVVVDEEGIVTANKKAP